MDAVLITLAVPSGLFFVVVGSAVCTVAEPIAHRLVGVVADCITFEEKDKKA